MPISDPAIQLALLLRKNRFEQETQLKCNLDLMSEVFQHILWKQQRPQSLSIAINDIFSIDNETLIHAFNQLEYVDLKLYEAY